MKKRTTILGAAVALLCFGGGTAAAQSSLQAERLELDYVLPTPAPVLEIPAPDDRPVIRYRAPSRARPYAGVDYGPVTLRVGLNASIRVPYATWRWHPTEPSRSDVMRFDDESGKGYAGIQLTLHDR